jgi:transketolase
LPVLAQSTEQAIANVARGAYVLVEAAGGRPRIVLIATGSEVHLATEAQKQLAAEGVAARVVSMPSWELFDAQPAEYRATVIPNDGTPLLAIEAGVPWGWYRYVGGNGDVIGLLDRFGESAPYEDIFKALGFTVENVTARALALLGRHQAATEQASRGETLVGSGAGPTEGHS